MRNFGYARRSRDTQILSLVEQRDRINEKVAALDGPPAIIYQETESAWAKESPWKKRSEFKRLCRDIEKGDRLVVWQLQRIDRDIWRSFEACRYFSDRGIQICVLAFKDLEIDTSTALGRAILGILLIAADVGQAGRIESVKRGVQRVIRNRFRCGGVRPPLGCRWIEVKVPPELMTRAQAQNSSLPRVRWQWAWDEHECNLIREAWVRYRYLGQSLEEIGDDYFRREETTPWGDPWVPLRPHKLRRNPQRDYSRIRWVCERLDDMSAKDEVPLELQIDDAVIRHIIQKLNSSASSDDSSEPLQ